MRRDRDDQDPSEQQRQLLRQVPCPPDRRAGPPPNPPDSCATLSLSHSPCSCLYRLHGKLAGTVWVLLAALGLTRARFQGLPWFRSLFWFFFFFVPDTISSITEKLITSPESFPCRWKSSGLLMRQKYSFTRSGSEIATLPFHASKGAYGVWVRSRFNGERRRSHFWTVLTF